MHLCDLVCGCDYFGCWTPTIGPGGVRVRSRGCVGVGFYLQAITCGVFPLELCISLQAGLGLGLAIFLFFFLGILLGVCGIT